MCTYYRMLAQTHTHKRTLTEVHIPQIWCQIPSMDICKHMYKSCLSSSHWVYLWLSESPCLPAFYNFAYVNEASVDAVSCCFVLFLSVVHFGKADMGMGNVVGVQGVSNMCVIHRFTNTSRTNYVKNDDAWSAVCGKIRSQKFFVVLLVRYESKESVHSAVHMHFLYYSEFKSLNLISMLSWTFKISFHTLLIIWLSCYLTDVTGGWLVDQITRTLPRYI